MSRKVSAQFKSSSDAYMSAQSDLDAKSDPQLQAAQSKVDTVLDIMKTNVNKMLDRDAKLTDLEAKGEELRARSRTWKKVSKDLETRHRCNSWCISLAIAGALLVLAGVVILALHPWNSTLFGTADPAPYPYPPRHG